MRFFSHQLSFAKTSAEPQNGAVLGGVGVNTISARYGKKTLRERTRLHVERTYMHIYKDRSKIDPDYAARL